MIIDDVFFLLTILQQQNTILHLLLHHVAQLKQIDCTPKTVANWVCMNSD